MALPNEDEPLKVKHRQYNKAVKEAIANNQNLDSEFKPTDNDMENLMKIDIACEKRDVNYIISILKSEDLLYVSRALNHCVWLVREQQYAHIINPQYLRVNLYPHMTTKAYIKLIKHIILTLKDEARAEEFYQNEKNPKEALRWLPLCSITFIENNVEKHANHIKVRLFKRLCEKSISLFQIVMKLPGAKRPYLEAVTFILNNDVDLYLNTLECVYDYESPNLTDNATNLIMKHSPDRIITKFEKYITCIHIPTFVKYLKKDNVKTFLYDQAKKDLQPSDFRRMRSLWYDHLNYFIQKLPKDEQFEFVRKIFIDRVFTKVPIEDLLPHTEEYAMQEMSNKIQIDNFSWYEYASFETAHAAYRKFIFKNPDLYDKYSLLSVLVKCANHNLQHIRTVLQSFIDLNKKEDNEWLKINFIINDLLSVARINEYDEQTWNLLNQIFKDLKINEEENSDQKCLEVTIVYCTLHDIAVPEIIEKLFQFNTLKSYQATMTEEQKEKIFRYLYKNQISKLNDSVSDEEQLIDNVDILKNILYLLSDWQKDLCDYPAVLNKIREYIGIKKEKSWKTDLSQLYSVNKTYRRQMFEESLSLNSSEEVCVNALKHSPPLLAHHGTELRESHAAKPPVRLLHKLRLYYTDTLAKHWIDNFFDRLNTGIANRGLIRGLFTMLPQKPLMDIIEKNAPATAKIDWNNTDEKLISLQRFIAKNVHVARPQPHFDAIMLYAKGDYLQYALPSLLAIIYNLNPTLSRLFIPKLLHAPVSLQKHGIRSAYRKFDHEEVKEIFLNCWNTSKNASIRSVIFKFTYTLLCNEKDDTKIVGLWKLLESFIQNLSFDEDKKIYELLFEVEKIPLLVRANYLMEGYRFMKKFLPNAKSIHLNYEQRTNQLAYYSREVMEFLTPDFVTSLINEYVDKDYTMNFGEYYFDGMIPVISAYILYCKDAETQTNKYEQTLLPIMQRTFEMWDNTLNDGTFIKSKMTKLLMQVSKDLRDYVVSKNLIVPTKMFVSIQKELEKSLPVPQNYLLLCKWKLIVALAILIEKTFTEGDDWDDICSKITQEFGKVCLEYLKDDVKTRFPCIYILFSRAFTDVVKQVLSHDINPLIYEEMLSDPSFIPAYLAVIQLCYNEINNECNYKTVKKMINSNDSIEVKFHKWHRCINE